MDKKTPFPADAWPAFKAALQHLAEEPRRLNMRAWILDLTRQAPGTTGYDGLYNDNLADWLDQHPEDTRPPCGTTMCLAGAVLIANGVVDPHETPVSQLAVEDYGAIALDTLSLDDEARYALETLFYRTNIDSYQGLVDVLKDVFTFPEPLPTL